MGGVRGEGSVRRGMRLNREREGREGSVKEGHGEGKLSTC